MKLSARNMLKGTIKSVTKGAVNGIVVIDLGDDTLVKSSITNEAIENLSLAEGGQAYAVIKASDVMIGVD